MPSGRFKNQLYHVGLVLAGKRVPWKNVSCINRSSATEKRLKHDSPPSTAAVSAILRRHHTVGASIQVLRRGRPVQGYTAGFASLVPSPRPVMPSTYFRTASLAKTAIAMLALRLETLGYLSTEEDISDFLAYPVRNPHHPSRPVTLGMLLSHTSSIVDSPAYFSSFTKVAPLPFLLKDPAAFSSNAPGAAFCYSNLAAGMVACLLEARLGQSFEAIAQQFLFSPLGISATFDLSTLAGQPVADSYRVFPPSASPSFSAFHRLNSAMPLEEPQPDFHYLPAAGGLFISALGLATLLRPLVDGGWWQGKPFLSSHCLSRMKQPLGRWPDKGVAVYHGMGLLSFQEEGLSRQMLYGHQGLAYGAVNGLFFNEAGDGFVLLNSGASEQRKGHLALLNRDLIRLFLP